MALFFFTIHYRTLKIQRKLYIYIYIYIEADFQNEITTNNPTKSTIITYLGKNTILELL